MKNLNMDQLWTIDIAYRNKRRVYSSAVLMLIVSLLILQTCELACSTAQYLGAIVASPSLKPWEVGHCSMKMTFWIMLTVCTAEFKGRVA